MKRVLAWALIAACLGAAAHAQAAPPARETLSREEIVERILELRRELDALLAALPPEVRAEVERRLAAEGERPAPPGEPAAAPPEEPVGTVATPSAAPSEPSDGAAETPEDGCVELAIFDSNGDGALSGFDRYWRYFKLWRDDGDGTVEASEVSGLYDAGIREVSGRVDRYETLDAVRGDARVDDAGWFMLDLFDRRAGSGALMIDAERLAAGGELALVDDAGEPLSGLRRLGRSTVLASGDDSTIRLACP